MWSLLDEDIYIVNGILKMEKYIPRYETTVWSVVTEFGIAEQLKWPQGTEG